MGHGEVSDSQLKVYFWQVRSISKQVLHLIAIAGENFEIILLIGHVLALADE